MHGVELSALEWFLIMIAPPLTVVAAIAALFLWGARMNLQGRDD